MIKKLFSSLAAAIAPKKPNTVDAVAPTINVINKSTILKDPDFKLMVEACQIQLAQHVAPMWLRGSWNLVANQPENIGYPIVILDNPDQAGALGYHTETPDGKVWGRVFVNPVVRSKGTMTQGSMSVSAVLSHEVIEAYCDPNVNLWVDRSDDVMVAYEACDPVENDSYEVTTKSGAKVSVSNFVLPSWFDGQADVNSKFDFMAKLSKPFSMSKGGYLVTLNLKDGKVTNIFGSIEAKEKHETRQDPHPASRSSRKSVKS
jgi:hypothetical protein